MSRLAATQVLCRQIALSDLANVVDLLHIGFPHRSKAYWEDGLRRIAEYAPPPGSPRFGYVLEADGQLVGVLLLISSHVVNSAIPATRTNVSSWYVHPEFRPYAGLLSMRATRNSSVTYINVWPADHTPATVGTHGFSKATEGYFIGAPALSPARGKATIMANPDAWSQSKTMSESDSRLLADHQSFGCICLWCETSSGGRPFIFKRRSFFGGWLPCAMLIYANSLNDVEELAGPVGRYLAFRGFPVVLIGSDRPLQGMIGRHFSEKLPIYFKGSHKPRGSDLTYTDAALFGI